MRSGAHYFEKFSLYAHPRVLPERGERKGRRERERERGVNSIVGVNSGCTRAKKIAFHWSWTIQRIVFFFFSSFCIRRTEKREIKKKEREKTSYTIYRQQLQGLNAGPFRVVRREDISAFIYILSLFYFSFFFFRMCPVKKYKSKHGWLIK